MISYQKSVLQLEALHYLRSNNIQVSKSPQGTKDHPSKKI